MPARTMHSTKCRTERRCNKEITITTLRYTSEVLRGLSKNCEAVM